MYNEYEEEIMMSDYATHTKDFKQIITKDARELLEAKEADLLYIGRSTCPYCRKFVTTLGPLAEKEDWVIYYLQSDNEEDFDSVNALRNELGIQTVPAFLYADKEGVHLKMDSSLTEGQLVDFVG